MVVAGLFTLALLMNHSGPTVAECKTLLPKSALETLSEVERLYAKPVRCFLEERIQQPQEYYGGESTVAPDGTPEIHLNAKSKRKSATVTHELFHLLLRARGYPYIHFATPQGIRLDEQFVTEFVENLTDLLSHAVFYPKMRELGVDPSANAREWLQEVLTTGKIDLQYQPHVIAQTLILAKFKIEVDDRSLLDRLEARYRALGWEEPLKRSAELVRLARFAPGMTPEEFARLIVEASNVVMRGQFTSSLIEWQTGEARGVYRDRFVLILFSPR